MSILGAIGQPSPNFIVGWAHVLLGSQLDESLGSRGILDEPDMLTPDMKRIIEEQRLGFVATASLDGTPNVSPKGTFAVLDDQTIAFGEIDVHLAQSETSKRTRASRSTSSMPSCAKAIVLPAWPPWWNGEASRPLTRCFRIYAVRSHTASARL